MVLRLYPAASRDGAAHREHRVLEFLEGAGFPAPRALTSGSSHSSFGLPYVAMSHCPTRRPSSGRFAPLDHPGCQLLFRLVAAYDKRSSAISSHSPFENWGRFLSDQPTAVSVLDRLCHHAQIITAGDSYRLTHHTTGGDTTA